MYYVTCPKCNKDITGKIIKTKSNDKPRPKLMISITPSKHKNAIKEQCDGTGVLIPWNMVKSRF